VPIKTRLFDASGEDQEVELHDHSLAGLSDDKILWIDVLAPDSEDMKRLAAVHDWQPETLDDLGRRLGRARIRLHPSYVHLTIASVVGDGDLRVAEIDLLVGRDFVVTVHRDDVPALIGLDDEHRGDSRLGKLGAGQFMGVLVDRVLTDYAARIEAIEGEVDKLDDLALRAIGDELLEPIIRLRRRIAFMRRALAPHDAAFAALSRPDFELHEELGQPWPGLIDRLRQTMAATENARELLLGSFDVLMAHTQQRSNRAIQTLTVLSAMFLPAAVLAGVMGMNFALPLFDDDRAFVVVVGVMVGVALAILGVARVKHWI
jgi:magnesium transporter